MVSKEDHDSPYFFLLFERLSYGFCFLLTDPLDFSKPFRLMFDDIKSFRAEVGHKLLSGHRADSFDKAGSEIFLDTFDCSRDY